MTDLIDIHSHLPELEKTSFEIQRQEIRLRKENNITTCYSCGSPKEWEELAPFLEREELLATFGIHPWFADRFDAADYMDIFGRCAAVGEIGLDSGFSEVPLKVQQRQLEKQLQIAADLNKPIVIHCDGREYETAQIIRDFPGKKLIHWFAGEMKALDMLLDMDCYFSLGPDTDMIVRGCGLIGGASRHEVRRSLVSQVPLNRVFVETDGLEAVAWALGKEQLPVQVLPVVLKTNAACFAACRGLSIEEAAQRMKDNFKEFFA